MNSMVIPLLTATFAFNWFGSACPLAQQSQRSIPYKRDQAIADRLLPGDRAVVVYKETLPGLRAGSRNESFDEEVLRLRRAEAAAVVRVAAVQGELIDDGTWIRTHVSARVEQTVKAAPGRTADSVDFAFNGGTMRIGETVVTAGTFPKFAQGERYLVFLITDPGIAGLYPSLAYRINVQGVLEHIENGQGGTQSFKTNLVGRDVADVIQALTGAK